MDWKCNMDEIVKQTEARVRASAARAGIPEEQHQIAICVFGVLCESMLERDGRVLDFDAALRDLAPVIRTMVGIIERTAASLPLRVPNSTREKAEAALCNREV